LNEKQDGILDCEPWYFAHFERNSGTQHGRNCRRSAADRPPAPEHAHFAQRLPCKCNWFFFQCVSVLSESNSITKRGQQEFGDSKQIVKKSYSKAGFPKKTVSKKNFQKIFPSIR